MVFSLGMGMAPSVSADPAVAPLAETIYMPETLGLTPGSDTSKINLNWYSDDSTTGVPKVEITPAGSAGATFSGTQAAATTGKLYNKVTVTGLAANTTYSYRVSSDGGNEWSEEYTYKTPAASSFKFAVTGDPQLTTGLQDNTSVRAAETTAKGWQDTIASIAARGVNFIAGVGDQVDVSLTTNEAEYLNFFAPEALRSIPYAPAVGNHDRNDGFEYHYNLPNEQSFDPLTGAGYGNPTASQAEAEARGNYYYTYNNALFVVLNTSSYPTSTAAAAEVVARFDDTLDAAVTANPNYTWLFVQHHKSTASVADHLADRDIQYYVEAGFEKLMDDYKVDFVLAGHDHVYARSYPIKNSNYPTNAIGTPDKTGIDANAPAGTLMIGGDGASSSTNPGGTIYFTTTTASGLKYYELFNNAGNLYVKDNIFYPYLVDGKVGSIEYAGANITNIAGNSPSHDVGNLPLSAAKYLQDKTPGYMYVEVGVSTVTFKFYNLDDYATTPYDTYTVTKSKSTGPAIINPGSSESPNASISPTTATFDKNGGGDILVTLSKGSYTVSAIKNDSYNLVQGTDYTVSGNEYTLKAAYLETLAAGNAAITFIMSGGTNPVLTVTVKDTAPVSKPFPFTDIPASAWFYNDVKTAWETGLIDGKTASQYAPNDELTYAEAVKLAACMHQLYTTGSVTLDNGDPWYQSYVDYATTNGIISGDYDMNAPATRMGFMEIFANALPAETYSVINSIADEAIPDVPMTHPLAAEIYKLYRAGIVQGVDAAHNCNPNSEIKRSEVAAILTRMMNPDERISFKI